MIKILAGSDGKAEAEISVIVSKGPEEVEMLSVLGATIREAKLTLTQSGFVLGEEIEVFDPDALPNTVLEQWPEPGEIVAKGTAVNLVINRVELETTHVTLPDFRGLDFETVKGQLLELGLVLELLARIQHYLRRG